MKPPTETPSSSSRAEPARPAATVSDCAQDVKDVVGGDVVDVPVAEEDRAGRRT